MHKFPTKISEDVAMVFQSPVHGNEKFINDCYIPIITLWHYTFWDEFGFEFVIFLVM